ncbi:MAG: prepilin-type N-terminal cleavage/methylation domain-containing protein [Phycisphaerales bacterium]|nr:prepilin-type N-terminal cleavage/methylation domain-containing protein [Phycisphaerales bacterium]
MKRRGFTLIELLVVIAIISLLIAIILPALSGARQSGQSIKCMANLHNVGLALEAYFNVSDGIFPLSQAHGGYVPGTAWLDTLEPHTESKLQYRCPSDQTPNLEHVDPNLRRVTSYGINIYTGPLQHDWFPENPLGLAPFGWRQQTRLFRNPSQVVFAAEIAEKDAGGTPIFPDHFHPEGWLVNPNEGDPYADPQFSLQIWRHNRKANYLYADGHAAHLDFKQTFFIGADGAKVVNQYDPGFPHPKDGWHTP